MSYDTIRERFLATGGDVDEHPDEGWVSIEVEGGNGHWLLVGQVDESGDAVGVYAIVDFDVPEPHREAAALALTRLNYGLVLGNFELDLDDGEIRFKAAVPLPDGDIDGELVDVLVAIASSAVDHYLPALRTVAEGGDASALIGD